MKPPKKLFAIVTPLGYGYRRSRAGSRAVHIAAGEDFVQLGIGERVDAKGVMVGEYQLVKTFHLRFVPVKKPV